MTRSTSMRSFHHAGFTPLSPDGDESLSTRSKLSEPMKRSCTGCVAHCVNCFVSGSIAPSSMALSFENESFHGAVAFASAAFIVAIDCVPSVGGDVQFAIACVAPAGEAGGAAVI